MAQRIGRGEYRARATEFPWAPEFVPLCSTSFDVQIPPFGSRQFPAQAFHVQSVDLLKELLRDSDAFLALRIDGI